MGYKMTKIDIDALSLSDLRDLQREIGKAISGYEEKKKREALLALEERAREMGFSVAELTGQRVARQRGSVPPKYANPENPTERWSGRGRSPKWFAQAMKAGVDPDAMLIK